jgi:DNA-binding transcriptional MerR regulator
MMAYREKNIEKLYYSIGEVSDMLQVAPSQIRYWESEFSELRPRKDKKGNRLFTKEDIQTIKLIHHLLREKGFTIEGAKMHLKTHSELAKKNFQLIEQLKQLKEFLEQLRDRL